jgi:hypothetical protein
MIRTRLITLGVAALAALGPIGIMGMSHPAGALPLPGAAATATPVCTFNGSLFPLVSGVSAGEKVVISCTGLAPLHPYLIMETSLLLGIDPKAAPLLTGKIVSLAGLEAVFAALPEINPAALTFPVSDLSGNLNETYVLPKSQAPDPNASCPPTTLQIDEGLIGCALATIDLTSFSPVAAGSAVLQYAGDPVFPPGPTLSLSTAEATPGQSVAVGDAPGATTFWWLSTLTALESLLGGGTAPTPNITVSLVGKKATVTAPNTVTVTPAVYNRPVLTPPKLSGRFTVPTGIRGRVTATVSYGATLLGFPLSNSASQPFRIKAH